MERFATEVRHRRVHFHNAVDAVRFSFKSQHSIAYLNLNLCEYSSVKHSSFFVSTDEKCRKILSPSRSLLYNLHLDFAKDREYALKNWPRPIHLDSNESIQHVGHIEICRGFYDRLLSDLIDEAMEVVEERKRRRLLILLRFSYREDEFLFDLEPRLVNSLIDCFYPEVTNSFLFGLLFRNFNLTEWMIQVAQPDMLEYLLRQSCLHARDFNNTFYDLIDYCIKSRKFIFIGPILKRVNAPEYSSLLICWYKDEITETRETFTEELLQDLETWTTFERMLLMLQIIWMSGHRPEQRCVGVASEALRLIWCTIPDPCITYKELEFLADRAFDETELRDIWNFYWQSIGEIHDCIEPRSLQHLCRTTVRRVLSENIVWIPDGVRQMGLPSTLEPFLNLEQS